MLCEVGATDEPKYLLEQRFRYSYASPVRRLRHRLVVVPRAVHGDQHRYDHGLTVSGSPMRVSVTADAFANHVTELHATVVDEWIEFETWSLVVCRGVSGVTQLPRASIGDSRFLDPTPLTSVDDALGEVARDLAGGRTGAGCDLDLAERVCAWTHRALTYEYGVTNVATTAVEAVAGGRGVCQDYAHIMLALCRAVGLPARYVSGHLVGEGGSHAWVEVVVTGEGGPVVAMAFDPTHDRRAGRDYLTVAVGRDYADVAPTSGTFEGTDPGVLSATKRLTRVA
jgi:transglutaminase-like putative cysteine protease